MTADRRPDLCSDCGEPVEPHDGDPEDRPPCPECGSTSRTVRMSARAVGTSSTEARAHVFTSYAERWWEDARSEVPAAGASDEDGATRHAVRRQVVFAVCAMESWFFEWVREDVLGDVTAAARLFDDAPDPVSDRVKFVLRELHDHGEIDGEPSFGDSEAWDDLHDLLGHRNGLVHALASLPRGDVPPDAGESRPTPRELAELAPARPLEVVRNAVDLMTSFADDAPPDWMEVAE